MLAKRTVLSLALTALFLAGSVGLLHSPRLSAQATPELPPISWVCPMPQDEVNEAGPGRCPICGMDLIPVRLDLAYTCPNHPAIITSEPGLCPLDRRELVMVTVALHWECASNAGQHFTEPGQCANGTPRRLVRELRAHGDHNPRHGGLFYMAADKWHHLEGTYPSEGLFRLFFYDNFTQPVEAGTRTGRVLVLDERNQEIASFPLRRSADGRTLEARVKAGPPPVRLAAMVNLDAKSPEQRFDFPLQTYSVEPPTAPAPAARPTTAAAAPAPAGAPVAPGAAVPAQTRPNIEKLTNCEPNMSRTDVLLLADALPTETQALLGLLHMCGEEVKTLIDTGQFGFVYQPTMLGKDISLALEAHLGDLSTRQRVVAADAIRRVVLVAWRLDMYGDLGNQIRLREAFDQFAAAIADLEGAYGSQQ